TALIRATRHPEAVGLKDLSRYVLYGASPRTTVHLVQAAKALAFLRGRDYVVPTDVRQLAPDVLRHRLVLSYEAMAEGWTAEQILQRLLSVVPLPKGDLVRHAS
ncbi:MAG TPA: ATPase, partial [Chloroflexota bacterium]